MKSITWQELARRLCEFNKGEKLWFAESFVGGCLSYNFLNTNKQAEQICSEEDLSSLVGRLLFGYLDGLRHSGGWQREWSEQGAKFFNFLVEVARDLEATSVTDQLEERLKEVF